MPFVGIWRVWPRKKVKREGSADSIFFYADSGWMETSWRRYRVTFQSYQSSKSKPISHQSVCFLISSNFKVFGLLETRICHTLTRKTLRMIITRSKRFCVPFQIILLRLFRNYRNGHLWTGTPPRRPMRMRALVKEKPSRKRSCVSSFSGLIYSA